MYQYRFKGFNFDRTDLKLSHLTDIESFYLLLNRAGTGLFHPKETILARGSGYSPCALSLLSYRFRIELLLLPRLYYLKEASTANLIMAHGFEAVTKWSDHLVMLPPITKFPMINCTVLRLRGSPSVIP